MAKKSDRKSLETLKKRARSSVGRAPQWHRAALEKSPPKKSKPIFPKNADFIEIPEDWVPGTAMREVNGKPFLFRVLRKITPKRLENDLKARRGSKTSA